MQLGLEGSRCDQLVKDVLAGKSHHIADISIGDREVAAFWWETKVVRNSIPDLVNLIGIRIRNLEVTRGQSVSNQACRRGNVRKPLVRQYAGMALSKWGSAA
jgi:hypothetical protein